MREKVEPTILSAHEAAGYAHICCRLTSSSTTTRIGSGKHCQYGVRAGKSRSQPGRLEIAKVYSTHTCPADVQKARTHDQTSVGTLHTLGEVVALREHLAQHQEKLSLAPSTTGDTTAPEPETPRRPTSPERTPRTRQSETRLICPPLSRSYRF